jgi:hypothetical protein
MVTLPSESDLMLACMDACMARSATELAAVSSMGKAVCTVRHVERPKPEGTCTALAQHVLMLPYTASCKGCLKMHGVLIVVLAASCNWSCMTLYVIIAMHAGFRYLPRACVSSMRGCPVTVYV